MKTFTVFSSCYNSAGIIDRLFDSIKSQTFKDFEWIVFDDFSIDNTSELIQKFINNNLNISIKFIKNATNKGLDSNYLEAMKIAQGRFLVQWDHDDIHKADQLQIFNRILSDYDDDCIAGIWALCEDQNGNLLGNKFPGYITRVDYFSYLNKYITKYGTKYRHNERMPCIKISKFRELLYMVKTSYQEDFQNVFLTFRWALLSMMGNQIIFINEVVRVYFINQSFTTESKRRNRDLSNQIMLINKYWINLFFKYLNYDSIYFKFSVYQSYTYHGILSRNAISVLTKNVKTLNSKLMILFLYFPIWIYCRKSEKALL